MMIPKVLLVDDNLGLILSIKQALQGAYWVDSARTGKQALDRTLATQYQCVVLDIGLPDMAGLDVCSQIRERGDDVPIIVLSGDDLTTHKIELFDAGADDYVVKPVSQFELEARIRTAIRRQRSTRSIGTCLSAGGVTLDSRQHSVERDGTPVKLRPKEFALLECLMNNVGHVVSRPVLLQYAWEDTLDVWTNVVDVHIKYLRDKLDHPFETPLIKTVHGLGYKFDASSVANSKKGGQQLEGFTTKRTG